MTGRSLPVGTPTGWPAISPGRRRRPSGPTGAPDITGDGTDFADGNHVLQIGPGELMRHVDVETADALAHVQDVPGLVVNWPAPVDR